MLRTISSRLSGKKKKKKRSSAEHPKSGGGGATPRQAPPEKEDKEGEADDSAVTPPGNQQVPKSSKSKKTGAKKQKRKAHHQRSASETLIVGAEAKSCQEISTRDAHSLSGSGTFHNTRLYELLDGYERLQSQASDHRRRSYPGMQSNQRLNASKSTPSLHQDHGSFDASSVPPTTSWNGGVGTESTSSLSESVKMERGAHAYLARVPPRHSSAQELNRQNEAPSSHYPYAVRQPGRRGFSQEYANQYWNKGDARVTEAPPGGQQDPGNVVRGQRFTWEQPPSQGGSMGYPGYPTGGSRSVSSLHVPAADRNHRYTPANSSYSETDSMQDIPGGRKYQHQRFSSLDNGGQPRPAAQGYHPDHNARSPSFTSSSSSLSSPHYAATHMSPTASQISLPNYTYSQGAVVVEDANSSSQIYTKTSATTGTSTNHIDYQYVSRSTPYYNTSTQTDVGVGPDPPVAMVTMEEKSVQARPESLINNVYQKSQLDTALNAHFVDFRPSTDSQETQTQLSPTSPPHSKDTSSYRAVSKMEQKRRIPETIREVSHEEKDRTVAASEQEERINQDVIAKISEYSPSQTDMLRKLSQEFYHSSRGKPQGAGDDTGAMRERPKPRSVQWAVEPQHVPTRHDKSDSGFCSREASQDQGAWQENTVGSHAQVTSDEDMDELAPSTISPFERRGKAQMSMRKAYGIFDEVESIGDKSKSNLLNDGKQPPAPQVASGKTTKSGASGDINKGHKKRGLFDKFKSHSKSEISEEPEPAEGVQKDGEHRHSKRSGHLRRTTSEQLRPIKEKKEKRSKKHRNSDPKDLEQKKHKGSDPTDYQLTAAEHGDNTNKKESRIPSESDNVFHESGVMMRQRNPVHSRSVSGSSAEDRQSDSRQHQQNAVMGFYERKTGKRVSTSSLDTSMSASERSLYSSRLSSSESWTARSPSPPRVPEQQQQRTRAMKKSVSLPRDIAPPYALESSVQDVHKSFRNAEERDRRVSSSTSELSPAYAEVVPQPAEKKRAPAKPPRQRVSSQESTVKHAEETSPNKTSARIFDYGSVSSPRDKPNTESNTQRSSFHVTVNSTYDEDQPPSLPPRNYRPSQVTVDTVPEQNHTPEDPAPAPTPTPAPAPGKVTSDYDFTPKAASYADQLRASARRISQSQRLMSARYLAKAVPETKTSISVSRPVEKPPPVQEAKTPSAIYRCTEYPKGLNLVGLAAAENNNNSNVTTNPAGWNSTEEGRDRDRDRKSSGSSGLGSPLSPGQLHSPPGPAVASSPVGNNTDAATSPGPLPPPPPPHTYTGRTVRDIRFEARPLPPPPPLDVVGESPVAKSHPISPLSSPEYPPYQAYDHIDRYYNNNYNYDYHDHDDESYPTESYMNNRRPNLRQGYGGNYHWNSSSNSSDVAAGRDVNTAHSGVTVSSNSPVYTDRTVTTAPAPAAPTSPLNSSFLPGSESSQTQSKSQFQPVGSVPTQPLVSPDRVVRVINVSVANNNKTGPAETRPQPDISMIESGKVSMEPPWTTKLNSPPLRKPFRRTYGHTSPQQQTSPKLVRSVNIQQHSPHSPQPSSPKMTRSAVNVVTVQHSTSSTNSSPEQVPRSESPSVKMVVASFESSDSKREDSPGSADRPSGHSRSKIALMKETLFRHSNDDLREVVDSVEEDVRRINKLSDSSSPSSTPQTYTSHSITVITPTNRSFGSTNSPHSQTTSPAQPDTRVPSFVNSYSEEPVRNATDIRSQYEGYQHAQYDRQPLEISENRDRQQESLQNRNAQQHSVDSQNRYVSTSSADKTVRVNLRPVPDPLLSPSPSSLTNNVDQSRQAVEHAEQPAISGHVRQKSQEELVCEQQAAVVAQRLSNGDSHLSAVILPPPEHKTTTDYMSGIFDTNVNINRRPSLMMKGGEIRPIVMRRESLRQPNTNSSGDVDAASSLPGVDSAYWSPPSLASMHNKMRDEGIRPDNVLSETANTSLDIQKAELINSIEKKLCILREEEAMLKQEIDDNNQLGKQITAIVQKKVDNKAKFNKYRLYVDELDKVMYLLLKLSGRLARAENAVRSLGEDASQHERDVLVLKRDELSEKHNDAKEVKEGIDRRSQQVGTFLREYLCKEEFEDYEYFIKMKSKLTMDQQEIDDKIKLGQEQLQALRQSVDKQAA